jgi:hypothetical protein
LLALAQVLGFGQMPHRVGQSGRSPRLLVLTVVLLWVNA